MNEILGVLVSSMQADMARAERVATNLANVQTPAYKREIATVTTFAAEFEAASGVQAATSPAVSVHLDARPGTLRTTGQSLDVAIVGDGWFEVATDSGPAYTRKGNFRLDAGGRLVTQEGSPVMGTGGEILLARGAAVIDTAGRVFDGQAAQGMGAPHGSAPAGQIKVVQFERASAMQPLGNGLYAAAGEAVPAREGAVQLQQGALENANVSQLQEMVRLMETVRHFESLQRVTVGYDEMLATSIRKLGEA
ncbi:MAG TPA: flagellar hook-basal body protein [Ramlibacter sp.]|uniref:flagellar hook-basal body protein n=1 Tax=Ramlibacter sp. TaxID=1917967 RepID=UPI002ED4D15F